FCRACSTQFYPGDINQALKPLSSRFRIYRETLSRFSCAASLIKVGVVRNQLCYAVIQKRK
ncbi:hypothetical protein ACTMQO_15670, partial [Escherichia coli]